MSARRILVTAVAIATLVVPTVAQGATIRITSAAGGLLGNQQWSSGSTGSYVNSAGEAKVLPAGTMLGQLVAATAFTNTKLVVTDDDTYGAYVTSIGTQKLGAKATWDVYVNGRTPQLGAGALVLKKADQVIWFLDDDYSKVGPVVLDLAYRVAADGAVTFTVRKAWGKGWSAAKGAKVTVDGTVVGTTGASGTFTYTPTADWDEATATQTGAIGSQTVIEAPVDAG